MAATSFHVSSLSVSPSSDEVAVLELVAVVELVVEADRVDADPNVEDGWVAPELLLDTLLDLSCSLVPDSRDDREFKPDAWGRRYPQSSSMACWQRRHSDWASATSAPHTWYCLSRRRTPCHVSLSSRSRISKRAWVTGWRMYAVAS